MRLAETAPFYGTKPNGGFPGVEQAFAVEDHPVGVLFYRAKTSFFMPYHLLQTMRFEDNQITVVFAMVGIVISGRGLHQLYTQLAAQRVSLIVEQGARYAGASDAPVHINKIEEIPREE